MKNLFTQLVLVFALSLSIGCSAVAQDSIPPKKWQFTSVYGLNITQSAFVNWLSGGRNSISGLGYINLKLDYAKDRIKWQNTLDLSLGMVKYFDVKKAQKTNDQINFSTDLGYKIKKSWYASLIGTFRTQSLNGYLYPNDSVRISSFMAPAYTQIALGIEYAPNEHFGIMISPVSAKFTTVNDQFLADQGDFGVRAAQYDPVTGERTALGQRFRAEFGAYLKVHYDQEIAKNIFLQSNLQLFSNYLHNPQNIDVNASVMLTFKVNNWFTASLQMKAIYDDDIKMTTVKNGVTSRGPRTQFMQVLGLGVQYTFKNFKDPVDKK